MAKAAFASFKAYKKTHKWANNNNTIPPQSCISHMVTFMLEE